MLFSGGFWMLLAVQRSLRSYVLQTSTSALPFRTITAPTWSSKQTSIYLCFSCVSCVESGGCVGLYIFQT